MDICSIRAIEGKNVYCLRPVIVMDLDLQEYDEVYTDQIPGFYQKLKDLLPGLAYHHCSRRKEGGFLERVQEGTLLGHVIEHISLELQYLAGCKAVYGKTTFLNEPSVYRIVLEYKVKEVAIEAAKMAVELVQTLLASKSFALAAQIDLLKNIRAENMLGPSTQAIVDACRKKYIPYTSLNNGSFMHLGYGKKSKRIEATITEDTSCLAVDLSCDKLLTKELLSLVGIPVPKGNRAVKLEEALKIAKDLGRAVTIKPINGNQGKGVALNLKNVQEITTAFNIAKNYGEELLVEEFVEGRHYRALVVGGKVVAVAERIAAFIVGDGLSTIKELIAKENENPLRGNKHEKALTKIHIDPELILVLNKKNLSLDTIPKKGERVFLRDNANISTGGIALDVTRQIHPDNVQLILRAVRTVGMDVAGVDFIAEGIDEPMSKGKGYIIEINAAPGIRMHHYPAEGEAIDVGEAIVDNLFQGESGRIPIVAITGTNGKTTTTRLIAQMFRKANFTVGMTTTSGVYINDECIIEGDTTGPESAKAVLLDKTVEAAVLETARGGMIRGGLAYDWSDVAVITNISEDHLGQDGLVDLEDLIKVKSLVLDALSPQGYAILNADDPNVVQLGERVAGKIIYFSLQKNNVVIKRHLSVGEKAIFILRNQIVLAEGLCCKKIINIKELGISQGGLATFNIQNVLAAVGTAVALNFDLELVKEVVQNFGRDRRDNPGRLEIYKLQGRNIIIDYGHNCASFEQVLQFAKKQKGIVRGVIGVPGDRCDKLVREAGKIAGKYCDYIYLKEDNDLRGRKKDEIVELLKEGVVQNVKFRIENLAVHNEELLAFQKALQDSDGGETIIIFYEELAPLIAYLDKWSKETEKNEKDNLIVIAK